MYASSHRPDEQERSPRGTRACAFDPVANELADPREHEHGGRDRKRVAQSASAEIPSTLTPRASRRRAARQPAYRRARARSARRPRRRPAHCREQAPQISGTHTQWIALFTGCDAIRRSARAARRFAHAVRDRNRAGGHAAPAAAVSARRHAATPISPRSLAGPDRRAPGPDDQHRALDRPQA